MISDRLKSNLKREFKRSLLAKTGAVIAVVVVFIGIFAPLLATHDPTATGFYNEQTDPFPPWGFTGEEVFDGDIYTTEPSSDHILGTNDLGQDVYSRLLYGARTSLLVGLLGTGLAVAFGVPFGLLSGYFGGRIDDSMMRVADMMLAFPSLVLAIALIGFFGQQELTFPDPIVYFDNNVVSLGVAEGMPENIILPGTVTLVVALVNWVWFARVARGEALSIRSQEYIEAARSMGASSHNIIRRHVLPNSLTPIIVLATIQVAAIIVLESALSFLGFSGTTLSWGYDIQRGEEQLSRRWWVSTVPGIGIMLAVISINLLGDWLRDALDPNIESEGGV